MSLTFLQHLQLASGLGKLLTENASDVAEIASDVPKLVRLGGKVKQLLDQVQGAPVSPAPGVVVTKVNTTQPSAAKSVPLDAEAAATIIERHGLSDSEQRAFDRASFTTGA